jgi:molybdopterin-containing oxidoreductase family membrane subunit
VAGAIYSGFAMVLTIAIPLRAAYGLKDFITDRHLDNMAKVMLASGLIVAYGYLTETWTAWYSGHEEEWYVLVNRATGPSAIWFWLLLICNVAIPQALWSSSVRRNVYLLFVLSLIINLGMWLERFVIVVISLQRDYLPSAWDQYTPRFWDWSTYIGTIGLFTALMFLFIRLLPVISIFEMREMVEEAHGEHE